MAGRKHQSQTKAATKRAGEARQPVPKLDMDQDTFQVPGGDTVGGDQTIVANVNKSAVAVGEGAQAYITYSYFLGHSFSIIAIVVGFFVIVLAVYLTSQHVLVSLGSGALYIAMVALITQWSAVRERLRGLDYKKQYLELVSDQHRYFDMTGLKTRGPSTPQLKHVYVELSLVKQPSHSASDDPLADPEVVVPEELRSGRHDVWDWLKYAVDKQENLVILGPPGSGKTTLLKLVALDLVAAHESRQLAKTIKRIPILLSLHECAAEIAKFETKVALERLVHDEITNLSEEMPPLGWVRRQLVKGRCLIMLDGLDEVANPELRKKVVNWVNQQLLALRKNVFVITSRPFGYQSNPLSRGVTVLGVRAFNVSQVQQFISNWHVAQESEELQQEAPSTKARESSDDLFRRLRNTPALAALAVNPLLLTMIANVHQFRGSLPSRRADLYKEICIVCLGERQQARGIDLEITPEQAQHVLEPLAYHMMGRQVREVQADEAIPLIQIELDRIQQPIAAKIFLQRVEEGSGLLLERETDVYGFTHLTFQEYLAATHIKQEHSHLEAELITHISETWWHETILLYAAQGRREATAIIAMCLQDNRFSAASLALAIECCDEASAVAPDIRQHLNDVIATRVEEPDPRYRRIVAEALLMRRLRRLSRLDDTRSADATPITNIEYQLFLDEQSTQGQYCYPDHWDNSRFPSGAAHSYVSGIRSSDVLAFYRWLSRREGDGIRYRTPHGDEIVELRLAFQQVQEWAKIGLWTDVEDKREHLPPAIFDVGFIQKTIEQQYDQDLRSVLQGILDLPDADNLVGTITRFLGYADITLNNIVSIWEHSHCLSLDVATADAIAPGINLSVAYHRAHTITCEAQSGLSNIAVFLDDLNQSINRVSTIINSIEITHARDSTSGLIHSILTRHAQFLNELDTRVKVIRG